MGEYINKLREFDGYDGYEPDEIITNMIEDACFEVSESFGVEVVHEEFESGGRWSNYDIKVYKVTEDDIVAYFKVQQEVPATEIQDGGNFSFYFSEVMPFEKTVIEYL